MPDRSCALLVFARAPVAGAAKTRLAGVLGAEGAARLSAELLERTLCTAAAAGFDSLELWGAPDGSHPALSAAAARHGARLHGQQGSDLGERMNGALTEALARASTAVLIGSDCPELAVADLLCARRLLESGTDLVLGPAEDGGYWLIGLCRACPALFGGMPWGAGQVLARTRERAAALGLACAELPLRWDLDRPEDLARYRGQGGSQGTR